MAGIGDLHRRRGQGRRIWAAHHSRHGGRSVFCAALDTAGRLSEPSRPTVRRRHPDGVAAGVGYVSERRDPESVRGITMAHRHDGSSCPVCLGYGRPDWVVRRDLIL